MNEAHDISTVWEELAQPGGRIVYLVLDGAGGLRDKNTGRTAFEKAHTPHLDKILRESSTGLLETVGPGITPGSGPGHLALFGYDPLRYRLGRGVLSALGIDFELREGDVAARINFATLDEDGKVTDRRAGRISSDRNRELCAQLRDGVELDFDGRYFLETVAEHRAVLILRGEGLDGDIGDTDPQQTGVAPRKPVARSESSERTAELVADFIAQAEKILSEKDSAGSEQHVNGLLLRGFQRHQPLRSLAERFGLHGLCIAQYPMYRGLSRLLGMDVASAPANLEDTFATFRDSWDDGHGFYFLHAKGPDKTGEDGDFQSKVRAIEAVDGHLPTVLQQGPDVLVVTSDHSTPASMAVHSWHPVPLLIRAQTARADRARHFDEYSCRSGELGLRPGLHLMGLALAHAGRLRKFGA